MSAVYAVDRNDAKPSYLNAVAGSVFKVPCFVSCIARNAPCALAQSSQSAPASFRQPANAKKRHSVPAAAADLI